MNQYVMSEMLVKEIVAIIGAAELPIAKSSGLQGVLNVLTGRTPTPEFQMKKAEPSVMKKAEPAVMKKAESSVVKKDKKES